jgi:Zinc dependent phospholipase C
MTGWLRSWICRVTLLLGMMFSCANAGAYSVLTHEELIDLAWNSSIQPLLLARFPGATEAQLVEAHAYAYGGCAIQDMGYYPFGKRFFSDVTHYVRSGDFVAWLFRNARTIDEYAFAIGALSHYLGDSIGHFEAINPATGVEFPKLSRRFGPDVTYDESPHGHIRTEFAFDVEGLTRRAFAPPAYMSFIGLQVPRKFLAQAFIDTYGFDVHEVLGRAHPALRSYRASARRYIPSFAEAEVVLHGHQFLPPPDDEAYRTFAERVARTNYERKWKHTYRGPGFKAHLLAIVVFIVPKVGAAADLAIKIPNHDTEELYLQSVNRTVDAFHALLATLGSEPKTLIALPNIDLDTGHHVKRGEYRRTDQTYERLLQRLTSVPGRTIPIDVQQNILEFYSASKTALDPSPQVQAQLEVLKGMKTADGLRPEPEPEPAPKK